jgi:uncharacterized protein (DUF302 family)
MMKLSLATALLAATLCSQAVLASPSLAQSAIATAQADGVLRVRSAYGFDETVDRLKADIADKGIRFFTEIDQSQLGEAADINLPPSKLLIFGNPPLGLQFLTSNRLAGLDWPVRMLVAQDADGSVWVAWTDFAAISDRYALADRSAAITMATAVSGSIASSVAPSMP